MADEIEKSFRQSNGTGEDDDDEEGSSNKAVEAQVNDANDDANARALRLIKQMEGRSEIRFIESSRVIKDSIHQMLARDQKVVTDESV